MSTFYTAGDIEGVIKMKAEWSGEGDNDTTVITFTQSEGNGVPAQTIKIVGAWEWDEFVRAIRNLDLARKGKPPLPSQFDDEDEPGDDAVIGAIATR